MFLLLAFFLELELQFFGGTLDNRDTVLFDFQLDILHSFLGRCLNWRNSSGCSCCGRILGQFLRRTCQLFGEFIITFGRFHFGRFANKATAIVRETNALWRRWRTVRIATHITFHFHLLGSSIRTRWCCDFRSHDDRIILHSGIVNSCCCS